MSILHYKPQESGNLPTYNSVFDGQLCVDPFNENIFIKKSNRTFKKIIRSSNSIAENFPIGTLSNLATPVSGWLLCDSSSYSRNLYSDLSNIIPHDGSYTVYGFISPLEIYNAGWSAVAYNGSIYCSIQQSSSRSAISFDGITWTVYNNLPVRGWNLIGVIGSRFCAFGGENPSNGGGTCYYSDDGINWYQSSNVNLATASISNFKNKIYGIRGLSVVTNYWYSSDGATFTEGGLPIHFWGNLASNDTYLCSIANNTHPSTPYNCVYSTDGLNWTSASLPIFTTFSGAAMNNDTLLVQVAASNVIYRTSNFSTWELSYLPSSRNWTGLCWNGNYFMCNAINQNIYALSKDGILWKEYKHTTVANWKNIISLPNSGSISRFFTIGNNLGTSILIDSGTLSVPYINSSGQLPYYIKY